jgi:ribonuclease P protein component
MPPKKNRADKKTVERIFKEGKFINSPNLTFKFFINRGNERRISVIVPKSVAKKAVDRNFLRRRGYSVLRKYTNQFPTGLLGVFIFKKYQSDLSIIEDEIKNILNKIN